MALAGSLVVAGASRGAGEAPRAAFHRLTKPAVSTAPVLIGTTRQGSRLGASTGTWTGSPTGYAFQWQRCHPDCAPITGATAGTYALVAADVGATIKVTAKASNVDGFATADSVASATVAAAPPGAPLNSDAPAISGTARRGKPLSASGGTWAGSGNTYSYRWLRCDASGAGCAEIAAASGHTYTPVDGDVGSTIRVAVTATNASGSNTAVSPQTEQATAGAAPVNTTKPSISGTPMDNHRLRADPGKWSGDSRIRFAYQWQRCDSHGGDCQALTGKTGRSYEVRSSDEGHTLRVLVTARNSAGSATALSAPVTVEAGQRPSTTKGPTISGTPMDNHRLRADPGEWSGDTPIKFAYQWQRCDSHGGDCQALTGKTGRSYEVRSSDEGHTLRVQVTARNSAGSTTALSNPVAVESRRKPTNTARPSISGTPVLGQTLTLDRGDWTGTTPIDYSYTWQRCDANGDHCSTIHGAGGSTYRLIADDVGHRLRVRVDAHNTIGSEQRTSAATPIVQETAPVNTSRPSIGGTARQGETLAASSGSWSSATPLSFYYQWARCDAGGNNCVPIPNAKSSTYRLTSADVGHRLIVQVKAQNRHAPGFANSAPTAIVASAAVAAPAPTSPPVIGGSTRQGSTLTASTGTWSSSTPATFFYQWARCDAGGHNCAPIANATRPEYLLALPDVGHRLIIQVKAQNNGGTGYANSAPTAVVQAAPRPFAPPAVVPVASVSLPNRLVIDQIRFIPSRIRSREVPLIARFHVSETRGGKPVSGALVHAVGVPFNRLSAEREVMTDGSGWAQVTFTVRSTFPLKRGYLVVVLVRARKPGGSILAGVSTRRFASVRVG